MIRHLTETIVAGGVALALAASSLPAQQQSGPHALHERVRRTTPSNVTVPLYDNLGDLHREIETKVPLAQQYFDQGLRLSFAFNHAEAIAAFRQAAELDSTCAMCFWGVAWAAGPNINAGMDSAGAATASDALAKAARLLPGTSTKVQDFVRAQATRYGPDALTRRKALDSAYAKAMSDVAAKYPADAEAQVLAVEANMVLAPWNYWTADRQPRPGTETMLRRLGAVLDGNPKHPGACHFYIHAVELPYPDRAVPCAERLAALMPGAGHLVHMPGHIYIRVGRYMDAIKANEHAVHADESWLTDRRPGAGLYTAVYYPHNYDFLAFAASMAGRSRQAIEAADRAAAVVPPEMLGAPGLTLLQMFVVRPYQMRVWFGRWDEILSTRAPAENLTYARGMWHYARGRALVAQGQWQAAEFELGRLQAAAASPDLQGASLLFNKATAILGIANDVLAGSLASARGQHERAIAHLRAAAKQEDALTYGEPPEWSTPVRHELGAALLAAGRAKEAQTVYKQDLARFPQNGWSLAGLARSLERQGISSAESVRQRFRAVWADADVTINSSRF